MNKINIKNGRGLFVANDGFEIGFDLARKLIAKGDRRRLILQDFCSREARRCALWISRPVWISGQDQRYINRVLNEVNSL